jgi:hypothetical protein
VRVDFSTTAVQVDFLFPKWFREYLPFCGEKYILNFHVATESDATVSIRKGKKSPKNFGNCTRNGSIPTSPPLIPSAKRTLKSKGLVFI